MITRAVTRHVGRLLTVLAGVVTLAGVSLALAGPASADVPEGWGPTPEIDNLEMLLLLFGVPILLCVVITAFVYAPALVKGESVKPGAQTPESQWIGGPRRAAGELAGPDGDESKAGGAGGSW